MEDVIESLGEKLFQIRKDLKIEALSYERPKDRTIVEVWYILLKGHPGPAQIGWAEELEPRGPCFL